MINATGTVSRTRSFPTTRQGYNPAAGPGPQPQSPGRGRGRRLLRCGPDPYLAKFEVTMLEVHRPDISNAADSPTAYRVSLKSLAHRYLELSDEIADLDELVNPVVEALAPQLLARTGIGSGVAGQLLVTAATTPTG